MAYNLSNGTQNRTTPSHATAFFVTTDSRTAKRKTNYTEIKWKIRENKTENKPKANKMRSARDPWNFSSTFGSHTFTSPRVHESKLLSSVKFFFFFANSRVFSLSRVRTNEKANAALAPSTEPPRSLRKQDRVASARVVLAESGA